MCMNVLLVCLGIVCMQYPQMPEEGVRSPGIRVTGHSGPPDTGSGS